MPKVIALAWLFILVAVVTTTARRFRHEPERYRHFALTVRDRTAMAVGAGVAVVYFVLNVVDGEGIGWAVFPSLFCGFIAAAITNYVRRRRAVGPPQS